MIHTEGGTILLNGKNVASMTAAEKQKIGTVMTGSGFSSYLKVKDVRKILEAMYPTFDTVRFDQKSRSFGLDPEKKIKELSTGLKARLQVLSALCHKAEILLLDEPTAGLDVIARDEVYNLIREFMEEDEESWLGELENGCRRIGRNLNDARGLIHSFRDCRKTMHSLFADLQNMSDLPTDKWEIAFELRLNLIRRIRIYADVLVITEGRVFPLEFKMKNRIDPEEVLQAAKYVPFLEILFGRKKDVFPALVLTGASELFSYEPIGTTEYVLPVCSGDMLFNVFNEAIGFLD